jgi:hypothetical protein
MIAHSYSGVDQTTPFGTPATATGTGTAVTVTATTAEGELVLDAVGTNGAPTFTEGANQTEMDDDGNAATSGTQTVKVGASRQDGADGGVMSWTLSASNIWGIVAASMKPAAATNTSRLTRSKLTHSPLVHSRLIG